MIRQKTEAIALAPFIELTRQFGLDDKTRTGQGKNNRLPLDKKNVYFQFGDLRVELPEYTVVVEVESAGGVTNLAKYWAYLGRTEVRTPIKLLHVFLQKSEDDYRSHLIVWDFLAEQMKQALGPQWEAKCETSRGTSKEHLNSALGVFEDWLKDGAGEPKIAGHRR